METKCFAIIDNIKWYIASTILALVTIGINTVQFKWPKTISPTKTLISISCWSSTTIDISLICIRSTTTLYNHESIRKTINNFLFLGYFIFYQATIITSFTCIRIATSREDFIFNTSKCFIVCITKNIWV